MVEDIREIANRILEYVDQIAKDIAMNPEGVISIKLLDPSEKFMSDILAVCDYAVTHSSSNVPQPSVSGQPQQHAPQTEQPTADIRQGFINSVQSSGMFPQASDATINPVMLATMARVYALGRLDEIKRIPGGWKAVELFKRDYAYVMQPGWIPDHSWKWWIVAPAPPPEFRMANNPVAQFMSNAMTQPTVQPQPMQPQMGW